MYMWRKGKVAYLQPSFTQMIYGYILSVFYILYSQLKLGYRIGIKKHETVDFHKNSSLM